MNRPRGPIDAAGIGAGVANGHDPGGTVAPGEFSPRRFLPTASPGQGDGGTPSKNSTTPVSREYSAPTINNP